MPIYKRCGRCGARISEGAGCPCLKQRHSDYDKLRRDRKSKQFYGSKEWQDAKGAVLHRDGVDVYEYITSGKVLAPDTVHHIIPLRDDWSKRVDMHNLISLHRDTHSKIEQAYKKDKEAMIAKLSAVLEKYLVILDRGDA